MSVRRRVRHADGDTLVIEATGTISRGLPALDVDEDDYVLTIHWVGGRHTPLRVAGARRVRRGREQTPGPSAVEVLRQLAGHWSDHELAITLNRMRSPNPDGRTWTVSAGRELRQRLGLAELAPHAERPELISAGAAARRLKIPVSFVHRLIRCGALPANQIMPMAPWQIPVEALQSDSVRIAIRAERAGPVRNPLKTQDETTPRLPGL